jgi:hypothetical protein
LCGKGVRGGVSPEPVVACLRRVDVCVAGAGFGMRWMVRACAVYVC